LRLKAVSVYKTKIVPGPCKRVLVVEDSSAFRGFVARALQKCPISIKLVCEVSDGLEAVQQAQDLQPDLVLLDISLPKLNGIEAARAIRERSPRSKILCLSQESSPDIVQTALGTGAEGYVHKVAAGRELIPALSAILQGERFISSSVREHPDFPLGHDELCKTAV